MESSRTGTPGGASVNRRALLRPHLSWKSGLVGLVVVVLLALAVERGLAWQERRDRLQHGRSAVAAATVEVSGLIEISRATSGDRLEQLLDGATAGFRSELESQAEGLHKALRKNDVTATGDVVAAGLVKLDGRRATVIVAARGTVSNKVAAEPEPRNYRLRVDLEHRDDRWLVSGLEFVA